MGPILFGAFLVIVWRAFRTRHAYPDDMLLSFSVPLIGVILVQALLSRAHANWAAPAYVAATVLVIATMVREGSWGWLKASFAVNIAAMVIMVFGAVTAGRLELPVKSDPYARVLGWREVAQATREELARARNQGRPFAAVLTDDRAVTAELLYYMRKEPVPILAWRAGRPRDHFELTRAFTGETNGPVLLVALGPGEPKAPADFAHVEKIATRELPAGPSTRREVNFYALSGYKGR
jgi:hypothetical protein